MMKKANFNKAIIAHHKIEGQIATIYKFQYQTIIQFSIKGNQVIQGQD